MRPLWKWPGAVAEQRRAVPIQLTGSRRRGPPPREMPAMRAGGPTGSPGLAAGACVCGEEDPTPGQRRKAGCRGALAVRSDAVLSRATTSAEIVGKREPPAGLPAGGHRMRYGSYAAPSPIGNTCDIPLTCCFFRRARLRRLRSAASARSHFGR